MAEINNIILKKIRFDRFLLLTYYLELGLEPEQTSL